MLVKKMLFSSLIISSLFLHDCKDNKKEIIYAEDNIKEITIKPENNLEKIIITSSPKIAMETVKNNEYLSTNIKNKPNLQDEEYLKNKISKFIESLEHTYVEKDTNNTIFYKVPELNLGQLQRIYLMYEYLKDSSCLQEMGKIIEEDIADKYAEHGGIILFNKNKLHFKTFESYEPRTLHNNRFYGPPDETFTTPSIGKFHLHAEYYDESKSANPSSMDLIISDYTIEADNEDYQFLIAPIRKGVFNIDYYGGEKTKDKFPKIFDLGNFSYDTTKIE